MAGTWLAASGAATDWLQVVAAFAGLLLVAGLGWTTLRHDRAQRQAQVAIDLARQWNEGAILEARKALRHVPARPEQRVGLAQMRRRDDWKTVEHALATYLSFLEVVAASVRSKAAHEGLVFELFGQLIVEAWWNFGPLVEDWRPAYDHAGGPRRFRNLEAVAGRFRLEMELPRAAPPGF